MILAYLKPDRVKIGLRSQSKEEVLAEVADLLNDVLKDKEEFLKLLKKREEIQSTGIGNYIAIPHASGDCVSHPGVAIGIGKEGVDFDALDGKPVKLIFMVAFPKGREADYIQLLARISRLLKTESYRKRLMEASAVEEVIKTIKEFDSKTPKRLWVELREGRVIHP